MRAFLIVIAVAVLCVGVAHGAASNTLADCEIFAAKFNNTCDTSAGPVSSILTHVGRNISCPYSATGCPGTHVGSFCLMPHKLCVTCSVQNGVTRVRIQTNTLPPRCTVGNIASKNIDFEVNYNADVTFDQNSLVNNPLTQAAVNTLLCQIPGMGDFTTIPIPATSNITRYTTDASYFTLVGIAIDGMMLLKPPSADYMDPFYPTSGTAPMVDQCLSHGMEYHYHSPSNCMLTYPPGAIQMCANVAGCSDVKTTMITNMPHARVVIGVALDGHPIFGPYDSNGNLITSGYDVCNGQFYDSVGNYGYISTNTMPYIPSCFGPASYPCYGPTCSTNPTGNFSRSSFMPAGACTKSTSAGASISSAVGVLFAVVSAVVLALVC